MVVQAIAISGQKMSKNEKMSKPLKQWLATLAGWSDDMSLEARIRFKIKDLQVRSPAMLCCSFRGVGSSSLSTNMIQSC